MGFGMESGEHEMMISLEQSWLRKLHSYLNVQVFV